MPWTELKPMDQKLRMVVEYLDGCGVTELACKYRVSRKTVYKWVKRYEGEGPSGLEDRNRAPFCSPNQTKEHVVQMIVGARKAHKHWGPKKLIEWLKRKNPEVCFPAPSTAGEWLKKRGLVANKKRSRKVPPHAAPLHNASKPNDIWAVDYKGEFRTADRSYCYPLTISDLASRYLICCAGLHGPRYSETKAEFERVFRKYGLPSVIRSDNGVPFAGRGICGLSRLSAWWLKLGIIPERIGKGKPQENGIHERMHRTLKNETANPAEINLARQNLRFAEFREEYNNERPHESLEMKTPVDVYCRSRREYYDAPKAFEYEEMFDVRSVRLSGEVKYGGSLYFLSNHLIHERVGFLQQDDEGPVVYAGFYPLCKLNLSRGKMRELTRTEHMLLLPMSPV